MCELGFLEPVQRILRLTADGSQKLLFSATLDREVAALVDEFLVDPAVTGRRRRPGLGHHRAPHARHRAPRQGRDPRPLVDRDGKTLVFARTRAYAEMLAEQFDDAGIPALALHGDLNQAKRTRNLERLTSRPGATCSWRPTSPRAASMSMTSTWSSRPTRRTSTRRTCTARAVPAAPVVRGRVVTLMTRQRRRRMNEMLDRAEIEAPFDEVRIGDDLIEELRAVSVRPGATPSRA